jgi:hypothetical protein
VKPRGPTALVQDEWAPEQPIERQTIDRTMTFCIETHGPTADRQRLPTGSHLSVTRPA